MSIKLDPNPTCRHTKTDGRRCKAPALTVSAFCYHHQLRGTRPRTISPAPALTRQPLAPLSDRKSILNAVNLVLRGLASGGLDPRTGAQMLKLIQIARRDLHRTSME